MNPIKESKRHLASLPSIPVELEYGFELVRSEMIAEVGGEVRVYRDPRLGTVFVSIENKDPNKIFATAVATPPTTSNGVYHIVEHSALGGSLNYPLKDPFHELIKGSLATFVNALTYPDHTIYPVASANNQDFLNLARVYLDAVLLPSLKKETFLQEGWRYCFDDEGRLARTGVVFNEMKGAFSDPLRVLYHTAQSSLLPDTIYAPISGGFPRDIPSLTYEEFKEAHSRRYHPSNALLVAAGDYQRAELLKLFREYLDRFEPNPAPVMIQAQPPFARPKTVRVSVDPGSSPEKAIVGMAWALGGDLSDAVDRLALEALKKILLDNEASPLRRALISSGMGEGLGYCFAELAIRDPYLLVSLKGVSLSDVDRVEKLILDTLAQLVACGIPREDAEAALDRIEFENSENDRDQPQGFAWGFEVVDRWLLGQDLLESLPYRQHLAALRKILGQNANFFSQLIERKLLRNPHRVTVQVLPEKGKDKLDEAEEREELDRIQRTLSEGEIAAIKEQAAAVEQFQDRVDSEDALKSLPRLELADLPRKAPLYPAEPLSILDGRVQAWHHDLDTQGIQYAEIGFDLCGVDPVLQYYVPLFSECLTSLGTTRNDYAAFSRLIYRHTGGLSAAPCAWSVFGEPKAAPYLFLSGRALEAKTPELMGLMTEALTEADWDSQRRFREIVKEHKSALESSIVRNGHHFAYLRARAALDHSAAYGEIWGGASQIAFVRALEKRVEADWPGVLADLTRLAEAISRSPMLIDFTATRTGLEIARPHLEEIAQRFNRAASPAEALEYSRSTGMEGLEISSKVNYVAKVARLRDQADGASLLAANYLESTYLLDQVRKKGGAYGAFTDIDVWTGTFACLSYRDPRAAKTVAAFDGSAEYLRGCAVSEEELLRLKIGMIGELSPHLLPKEKAERSLSLMMRKVTPEMRQRLREQVLDATVDDIKEFAEQISDFAAQGRVSITGNESGLAELSELSGGTAQIIKVA